MEWIAVPFTKDLPNPGIEPGSPALQVDLLPSELPGKLRRRLGGGKVTRSTRVLVSSKE